MLLTFVQSIQALWFIRSQRESGAEQDGVFSRCIQLSTRTGSELCPHSRNSCSRGGTQFLSARILPDIKAGEKPNGHSCVKQVQKNHSGTSRRHVFYIVMCYIAMIRSMIDFISNGVL